MSVHSSVQAIYCALHTVCTLVYMPYNEIIKLSQSSGFPWRAHRPRSPSAFCRRRGNPLRLVRGSVGKSLPRMRRPRQSRRLLLPLRHPLSCRSPRTRRPRPHRRQRTPHGVGLNVPQKADLLSLKIACRTFLRSDIFGCHFSQKQSVQSLF